MGHSQLASQSESSEKMKLSVCVLLIIHMAHNHDALGNSTAQSPPRKERNGTVLENFGSNGTTGRNNDDVPTGIEPSAGEQTRGKEISSLVCRKGNSKKSVTINGCTNIAYRTQKGVFYRGPTRCHTTFKVNKEQCSEATFSCSFSSIPNKG